MSAAGLEAETSASAWPDAAVIVKYAAAVAAGRGRARPRLGDGGHRGRRRTGTDRRNQGDERESDEHANAGTHRDERSERDAIAIGPFGPES